MMETRRGGWKLEEERSCEVRRGYLDRLFPSVSKAALEPAEYLLVMKFPNQNRS